jgi:hypothetical protein
MGHRVLAIAGEMDRAILQQHEARLKMAPLGSSGRPADALFL